MSKLLKEILKNFDGKGNSYLDLVVTAKKAFKEDNEQLYNTKWPYSNIRPKNV